MAASGVFISYRHDDSQSAAGRLADSLERRFGGAQIFRDVETLQPGVDFVDAIEKALSSCSVVLAVIGRRWMGDAPGQNRLKLANDWIRLEIATALKRGIRVIPVLVEGAVPPTDDDLPDDLKPLARRQALTLTDARWDYDVQQLSAALEGAGVRAIEVPDDGGDRLGHRPKPRPDLSSRIMKPLAWIGGIFVALILIGMVIQSATPDVPFTPAPQPVPGQHTGTVSGIASGMPATACGCWGYAMAGYTTPNPQCMSGYQVVQLCAGQCPAGGNPWQTLCQ